MAETDQFKGTPSRVEQLWGGHVWARGYLAVNSGTITDQVVERYIAEQEAEPVHDESQFVIDESTKLPPSRLSHLLNCYTFLYNSWCLAPFYKSSPLSQPL